MKASALVCVVRKGVRKLASFLICGSLVTSSLPAMAKPRWTCMDLVALTAFVAGFTSAGTGISNSLERVISQRATIEELRLASGVGLRPEISDDEYLRELNAARQRVRAQADDDALEENVMILSGLAVAIGSGVVLIRNRAEP
jgi:hypothetical protein